ncbi:VWA domain-containing protein [Pseudomonas sp. GD03860]|uniref:VWA domain-containing protein n=1 Tax=Pseudomonas TaxID=286 RepID=UPI002364819C|nr:MULTISPECIES: VWA domain-containing protein [Pseudomonas]MDD2060997.1 VWA domain-containing protein [Pseudomonas putida]MDH0635371.1 VWA domain-containing protein [Pseudomonas sp. GD03860]
MDIDLQAFHFLRPAWLWLLLPGVLLPWIWRHRRQQLRSCSSNIAPHLLAHLRLDGEDQHRLRPVHLASALLIIGALAVAGPTWEQDRPAFLDNRAPLILALDLSSSMDATDIAPTRLEAAKHKLHNLILRRKGAATGLIAYAGSAHLVMPPTRDPALLDSFLQALASDLIAQPGKNALAVVEQAKTLAAAEDTPATLVLVSDGADATQLAQLDKVLDGSRLQVLVLAVGSTDTGLIKGADGQPLTDSQGRPQLGHFDKEGLKQLASALDAPLGSLTLDDDDLDWIEAHAQQHFERANQERQPLRWKDAGYWLCWPLLLVAFLCIRRGWSLNWSACLLLGLLLPVNDARANALADAFMTPDQQGRWAFEHGHFPAAAVHFSDPYWKGIAAYNAADYDLALASFARLDTAPAYFYLGNIYTRRFKFDQAIAAYTQALRLQPVFPEAQANLALAQALAKDYESAQDNTPEVKPDKVEYDKPAGKGKSKPVQAAQAGNDELWLQNLTTSPANFLRRKFSLQDQAARGGP